MEERDYSDIDLLLKRVTSVSGGSAALSLKPARLDEQKDKPAPICAAALDKYKD